MDGYEPTDYDTLTTVVDRPGRTAALVSLVSQLRELGAREVVLGKFRVVLDPRPRDTVPQTDAEIALEEERAKGEAERRAREDRERLEGWSVG